MKLNKMKSNKMKLRIKKVLLSDGREYFTIEEPKLWGLYWSDYWCTRYTTLAQAEKDVQRIIDLWTPPPTVKSSTIVKKYEN